MVTFTFIVIKNISPLLRIRIPLAAFAISLGIFGAMVSHMADAVANTTTAVAVTASGSTAHPSIPKIRHGLTPKDMCHRIGKKLGSVSIRDCLARKLSASGGLSVRRQIILGKEYLATTSQPRARILLFGGIHGDEFSSVSIVFKWMKRLDNHRSGLFHWYIVPLLNPDGLLQKKSRRVNARNVDLNRNFPPLGKDERAGLEYWIQRTKRNPRRYPGPQPLSEPETRWLAKKIDNFQPDVIIAIHAPYGIVDFDGPPEAPERLGRLRLNLLGTYPGSLGNYAALQREIPVVTLELRYAGILPNKQEIQRIWIDLIQWLLKRFPDTIDGKMEKQ